VPVRRPRKRSRVRPSGSIQTRDRLIVPHLRAHHTLCDEIKRNLEHVRDFLQSCGCSPSPSAFQVGNIALSDASLVRDVELRFTAPLANYAQCIFAGGDSVNNFFRKEWHARRNLSPRARDQTRSSDIFVVGLTRLGGKCSSGADGRDFQEQVGAESTSSENGSGLARPQIDSAVKGNLIPRKDSRIS